MKRRRILAMAACLLALLLTACSAAGVFSEEVGATYLHMVCERYTGQRSQELTVGDNACVSVQCVITCKSGGVDVSITDETGAEAYREQDIRADATLVVQLTEPGAYTIAVNAADYTGSCSFDWQTVGAAAPNEG